MRRFMCPFRRRGPKLGRKGWGDSRQELLSLPLSVFIGVCGCTPGCPRLFGKRSSVCGALLLYVFLTALWAKRLLATPGRRKEGIAAEIKETKSQPNLLPAHPPGLARELSLRYTGLHPVREGEKISQTANTAPKLLTAALGILLLSGAGCAKKIRFTSFPLAQAGEASARVELTYNRNNTIEVELSKVPDPATLKDTFTRYVLWVATPDRQHVVNVGQLRIDENNTADISTLTPLRSFILFITAETRGDAVTPGPDIVFETEEINW